MKYLLTILLLPIILTSSAQNLGTIYTSGYKTSKNVQKYIDKQIEKGKLNKKIPSSFKSHSGDTLQYIVQYGIESFTLKLTFGLTKYNKLYCDYQEYIFDCTPCSQQHLKDFIDSYDFRQKAENVYISRYLYKTEMTVKYKSENKDCLIITFRHLALPKKEYKRIYHNLKEIE